MIRENAIKLICAVGDMERARTAMDVAFGQTDCEAPIFACYNIIPEVLADEMNLAEVTLDAWYDCFFELIGNGSTYLIDSQGEKIPISSATELYDAFYVEPQDYDISDN